jgi:3-dehydrosphinganine reductase
MNISSIPYAFEGLLASAVCLTGVLLIVAVSSLTTAKFDYKNKHVIITGGSSGIGLECAKIYLKKGANITIVARDKVRLAKAVEDLGALNLEGKRIMSVSVDTAKSQAAVIAAFAECLRELGPADVLVNSAGTSLCKEFDQLGSTDFEDMMRTNVLGSVYPTRAVIEGMKATGSGRIVFVSSQVAQVALHGYTAYGASKWALRGLAEALQMEVKPFGIIVSVAYPPDTKTPGYDNEMLSKPDITKKLSESGDVFSPSVVAADIVNYSTKGYFGISTGLEGWLLKNVHPGMSPITNIWEVAQGIIFSPLLKIISLFYIISWDRLCYALVKKQKKEVEKEGGVKKVTAPGTPAKDGVSMRVTRGSAKKAL